MDRRIFDHVDLRVRNLQEADEFYGIILPAIGFPKRTREETGISYDAERDHPRPDFIALIEDPAHVANQTRLAFWCETREAVDAFAEVLPRTKARNVEGPMFCLEYGPSYYAVFFEDPCRNRLEVCCRTAKRP